MTSFLLDELQKDTEYIVQVASYGDERFVDSVAAATIVKTDNDGKNKLSLTVTYYYEINRFENQVFLPLGFHFW